MRKTIQHLVRLGLFTLRYLVCPLIAVSCTVFAILVMPIINSTSINYTPLILLSLFYGFVVSILIFSMQIGRSVATRLETKANSVESSLSKKLKISIKTRIELRKYFLALGISLFLDCLVLFGKSIVMQLTVVPKGFELPSIELVTAYTATIGAFIFLQLYIVAYKQYEKATYFLERSVENIDSCLGNGARRPYTRFFGEALKAYQKSMPPHCSMNLEKRIRQTELVFSRGTKDDLSKIRDMITSLADSTRNQNPASFDASFSALTRFLDKFEKRKKRNDMFKIEVVRERRALKSTILQLGLKREFLILVTIFVVAFVVPNANGIIDLLERLF